MIMRHALVGALLVYLLALGVSAQNIGSEPPEDFAFDFDRWPYPLNEENGDRYQELQRQYPNIMRAHSIGKSRSGKDLWVVEITNFDTGAGESKPGLWMDGNIHAFETSGRLYLNYFIERMIYSYGKDERTTRLVDTRTFYVMPVFDADGGDTVMSSHPAWPGYEENPRWGRDLNGDGYITQMRWKESPDDDEYVFASEGTMPGEEWRRSSRAHDPLTGAREAGDFNRNWSAEWRPEEPGAGRYPFSVPEVKAVADFITSHQNVYLAYSIHSGGGGRSYIVRPPMNQPYEFMPPEDNDFYVRIGAIWSDVSNGGIMENNYYSFLFNTGTLDEEGNQKGYGDTFVGFMDDWAYMHHGIHSLTPEINGAGRDYDNDGWILPDEIERWHEEEKGGMFSRPWVPYDHSELGEIEIGGSIGIPGTLGETAKFHSEIQYDYLLWLADLSPLIRIRDVTSERNANGTYRVVATVENEGWLSTYVTRQAIKIRRDLPALARIEVSGGELVDGEAIKGLGHLLGNYANIGRYRPGGQSKQVEWTIRQTGDGPLSVSVEAWAPRGGRDRETIMVQP